MGEKEANILKNVAEEDVLIETVTGERSVSKIYGDTIFGKTRILNGRRGSVLVLQYATKKMYQVLNPDKDTFVLRGWANNPRTKGKTWYFVRDEERYGDKLLHCTMDIKEAKCFAATKETKFYDPDKAPAYEENKTQNTKVDVIHERFMHASADEMKHLLSAGIAGTENINVSDIDNWYIEKGKFFSGCVEGKMKEHEKKKSTKPLQSQNPGEVTVGDIMFVEMKDNIKKTLMIHVDVCTKMIVIVPLRNKYEEECTKALLDIREDYASKG
jgi:hypothetical protein